MHKTVFGKIAVGVVCFVLSAVIRVVEVVRGIFDHQRFVYKFIVSVSALEVTIKV